MKNTSATSKATAMNRAPSDPMRAASAMVAAVGTLAMLCCGSTALAQGDPPGYIHAYANGTIDKGATSGVRTGGIYRLHADSWDTIPGWDIDHKSGPYPQPPHSDSTRITSAEGNVYRAESKAAIRTWERRRLWVLWRLQDGWDSWDSFASVRVVGTPLPDDPPESAFANSFVSDPNSYEVLAGDTSTQFSITFEAGMSLRAFGSLDFPDMVCNASISGFMETTHWSDATNTQMLGRLFTYSWSASSDSATPMSSFAFSSNPLLGVSDADVALEFLSAVQYDGVNGFTLSRDVRIMSTEIAATEGYVYEIGGETNYNAAAVIPAPSVVSLLAIAGVWNVRRRRN
ncbi:MAG: hypothetical protein AABZ53_02930 [Planctomycetota bacterium]